MSKTIHVAYTFHPARASDTVAWTLVPREAGGGLRPSPRPWESLSVCIKHQDMAAVVVRGFHVSCLALSLSLGIRPPCHKEAQTTGGSHLWVCIRHVFSSDALSPEALLSMAGGQGGLPLPDQPTLIDSKQCTCELAFHSQPVNLEAIPPLLYQAPAH